MSWLGNVYKGIDKSLGGYLPGGVTPQQVSQSKQTTVTTTPVSQNVVGKTPTTTATTPTTKTSSGTGGGGGGGRVSSSGSGGKDTSSGTNLSKTTNESGNVVNKKLPTTSSPFLLTPKEASNYKGTQPVWSVESPTTAVGMVNAINIETPFIANVPIISSPGGWSSKQGEETSKAIYEYNKANIEKEKTGYHSYVNYQSDVSKVATQFQTNPESFAGQPGFTKNVTTTPTEIITTYGLSEDYYKTLPTYKSLEDYQNMKPEDFNKYLINARTSFSGLPSDVQRASKWSGVTIGTSQAVSGVIEGMTKYTSYLGVQTIDLNKQKTPDYSFLVPSTLKTTTGIPSEFSTQTWYTNPVGWSKELVTERPTLLGKGVTTVGIVAPAVYSLGASTYGNIQQYGWKLGTTESLSSFSPLRIQNNFAYSTTGEKFYGFMKETKLPSNMYQQEYIGYNKFGNVKVDTIQKFQTTPQGLKSVGFGETTVISPEVRYIGGNLFIGERAVVSRSLFTGESLGTSFSKGQYVGMGSKVNVLSQPIFKMSIQPDLGFVQTEALQSNMWALTKGGGSRFDVGKNIFTFRGGTRTPEYTTAYEKLTGGDYLIKNFYYYPSGYKVNVDIKGIGKTIDLSGGEITSFQGGGVSGKTNYFSGGGTLGKTISKTSQILSDKSLMTGITTTETKAGLIQSTKLSQTFNTPLLKSGFASPSILTTKSVFMEKQQPLTKQVSLVSTKELSKTIVTPIQTITPTTIQRSSSSIAQVQPSLQIQVPIQTTTPTPTVPTFPKFTQPNWDFGGGFFPFIFPGDFDFGIGKRKFKGKRRSKYTPSYGALVFKQYGKIPKGKLTGLESRPIPKGFSWSYNKPKKFKGIKFGKIKI